MSGRSALVRKKITEPKSADRFGKSRGRPKSGTSSDSATIRDYPLGPIPGQRHDRNRETEWDVTGINTTNARFLKFPEPTRDEMLAYHNGNPGYGNRNSGSHSGSSADGWREGPNRSHIQAPLDDFAYRRATRPTIKTEDVSGIEKSGLRSALDKKSSDVRNGLAKAFTFKKQDKGGHDEAAIDLRSQSSATIRPSRGAGVNLKDPHDMRGADIPPVRFQHHSHNPQWNEAGGMTLPSPSNGLPPMFEGASIPLIKRWIGAGRPVQRWNKLRKDPELWDPNGDVLIFFGQKDQSPWPNASFRLSSHIIEATESRYLITLLREGLLEEDIHMPREQQEFTSGGFGGRGQPTPPGSEDNSISEVDGQISYEIYFPTPPNMTKLDQLQHYITTRNLFALLYHTSLVGMSIHQALSDLHARLESYMPPGSDNIGTIINYLSSRGIDDARNDPETAVGLLAWSESTEVRWEEGWRESFLHCGGMYSWLESCVDYNQLSPVTRALLERAHLETQLRIQAAEERLAAFQYSDVWPTAVALTANASGPVVAAPAKAAADRLQRFLVQYYTREFGLWPPASQDVNGIAHGGEEGEEGVWLTRTVAQLLQRDFAALYDYLVDRDIVWDESEARSRKWMMVSESGNRGFEADTPDLPMTNMFIEFDNKHRFPHIPHPYPLVPESVPTLPGVSSSNKGASTGGRFGGKLSKKSSNTSPATNEVATERRMQLAYTEATNLYVLGSEFTHSNLIDAFAKFEKADYIGETAPSTARRGRWILIYGVLQTLASISVDAPNVRYSDGVSYHLSPHLKGVRLPPWKSGRGSHRNFYEAAHESSHCWTVPETWNRDGDADESSAEEYAATSPIDYGYAGSGHHSPLPRGQGSTHSISRASSTAGGGAHLPPALSSSAASVLSYYSESGSLSPGGRGRRENAKFSMIGTGSFNRHTQLPVDEKGWTVAGQQSPPAGLASLPESGPYTPPAAPSDGAGQWRGLEHHAGVFLGLDDVVDDVDVDEKSFAISYTRLETDRRVDCKAGGGAETLSDRGGSGTETDSVGPVIRDFDELGVDW